MNIPNNKIIQNSYVKKSGKFILRNLKGAAKRIIPGVCVMTCAFYVNHSLNKTPADNTGHATDANWAYHAGEQRIRDSLRIVELEQRVAADSMKIYHLTHKAGLDKAIKK